jgi:serine protease
VRERIVNGAKTTGAGTVQDTNGHGTNVAGLAAAATNNAIGYAGAGYNVRLQIYKIFPDATAQSDCQTAATSDEAQAITDAVANGASVISLSLGGPQSGGVDPAERNAVAFAIAHGVTVVAAAGNDYPSSDGLVLEFPAADAGVIAVGASTVTDSAPNVYAAITSESVASYSNSGATLVVPGGDPQGSNDSDRLHWIEGYSTTTAAFAPDRCSGSGGVCAALFAGTSQATPQAAAAAALMMSYHGGARSLTPATVQQLLTTTTDVLPGTGTDRQGAGRMNAGRAVAAAHP